MNVNLQNQIINTYPEGMVHFLPTSSNVIREVINCNDGWFNLLKESLYKIKELSAEFGEDIIIESIGTKWGELRIFLEYSPVRGELWDKVWTIIENVGADSFKVCERCGGEGSCRQFSVCDYRTLCTPCYLDKRTTEDFRKVLVKNYETT